MILDIIAQQASFKGLTFVGTGDFLHPSWMKQVQAKLEIVEEGTFEHPRFGTRFILTVEVEDDRRVHHLIISPSISSAEGLYEEFSKHSKDINLDGRPSLNLSAPEIVEISRDHDCLVGPSHAFTPWTSIYKEFDSISSCYEDQVDKLAFLELGLSADTLMADRLMELESVPFLSNSDAHSPWPNKLGREFNRFELSRPVSSEMIESIKEKKGISL
ncbi:phosphotransferase, partial [candidate division MSBL1 archaeon SCGC-AAA261F19]